MINAMNLPPSFTVMIAGIGGQGVMLASRVLATAGSLATEHVCRTESRGLSQRGGSVWSLVRFGSRTLAPVSGVSSVDLVVGLDALEAARAVPSLKPMGAVISDRQLAAPLHLARKWSENDALEAESRMLFERVERGISAAHHGHVVDALSLAKREGVERCTNIFMLGAAAGFIPLPIELLAKAVTACVHKETLASNLVALNAGVRVAEEHAMTDMAERAAV